MRDDNQAPLLRSARAILPRQPIDLAGLNALLRIIWHGFAAQLFPGLSADRHRQLEGYAANLFAGHLLMPQDRLTRAYADGIQEPQELAAHFNVTAQVILWRLAQTDMPLRSSDDIEGELRPTDRERLHPLIEGPA